MRAKTWICSRISALEGRSSGLTPPAAQAFGGLAFGGEVLGLDPFVHQAGGFEGNGLTKFDISHPFMRRYQAHQCGAGPWRNGSTFAFYMHGERFAMPTCGIDLSAGLPSPARTHPSGGPQLCSTCPTICGSDSISTVNNTSSPIGIVSPTTSAVVCSTSYMASIWNNCARWMPSAIMRLPCHRRNRSIRCRSSRWRPTTNPAIR